jgi:hypothetical protein
VQICRILAIKARNGRILHTNRKEAFYGFFPKIGENREKIGARIGLISLILSIGDKKWV